jgi:hypothetical protein
MFPNLPGLLVWLASGQEVAITVAAHNATHTVNPMYMGCHSDSGFGHQVRR